MITNNYYLTFVFLLISFSTISQNKVCESSENALEDLNAIGKCSIEQFKKSNKKEFVKVETRNRFVRKRSNSYLSNLKKNLVTVKSKANTKAKKITETKHAVNKAEVKNSSEYALKDFVRFDLVTNAPVFITCADAPINSINSCVKETFVNTILDNFIYPFDAAAAGVEGTVWVRFIIDKEGYVTNVTTKGPENGMLLEKEAERLISFLPKFIPGKHNNDFVNVEYFMPIKFQLDE